MRNCVTAEIKIEDLNRVHLWTMPIHKKSRYPELAMLQGAIANKTPRPIETRTRILHNIIWGGPSEWLEHHIRRGDNAWVVGKNLAGTDPLFVAPDKDNYHLRDGSPALP